MEFTSFKNKLYSFDRVTKEYLGETIAPLDPVLTKKNGKPTYACTTTSTFQKPPKVKKNEIQIYDTINDEWTIKKDFRGKEYYTEDGKKVIISNIDETIPDNVILDAPIENLIEPMYKDGKWKEKGLVYKGQIIKTQNDVNSITRSLIRNIGEEKAKTEKLLAGNKKCEIWDEFIEKRKILIEEGNTFIKDNNLEEI